MISTRKLKPAFRALMVVLIAALIPIVCVASDAPATGRPSAPRSTSPMAQDTTPNVAAPVAITQPLSPTALNIFNFGPHAFKVQYPPGSSFAGVDMTVTAVQISQNSFASRITGTSFSNSTCVVYSSELGNCIEYQVTCTNANKQSIQCPTSSASNIAVWTTFDSIQSTVNPGFLSAAIGTNAWVNKFDSFYLLGIDPTAHGHTNGWSEYVAASLGPTNPQGLGEFTFNAPLATTNPRSFPPDTSISVSFHLASVAHSGEPVTDASAGLTVVQVANADGKATTSVVFAKQNAFRYTNGNYEFTLPAESFPAGTYVLTVFGNAFETHGTYFSIQ